MLKNGMINLTQNTKKTNKFRLIFNFFFKEQQVKNKQEKLFLFQPLPTHGTQLHVQILHDITD